MLDRLPEFVGNHPILSLLFIGVLLALVFTEISRRFRAFADVSPAQLTRLINLQDATVLDVGSLTDYEQGHIINALHLTPTQVDPATPKLAKLKDKPLGVYCKTGMASEQVCKKLSKAGFSQVFWLKGGLQSWLAEQLPVTQKKK